MTDAEDTYQRAAEIADRLLAQGLPILGFGAADGGLKAEFAIRLPDGRFWRFRTSREDLNLETVERLVQAYL